MTEILAGIATVTTVVGDVFDVIVANPLLTFFASASVFGVCIGIFKGLRSSAR